MVVGLFISSFAFVCAGFVQWKIDVSVCTVGKYVIVELFHLLDFRVKYLLKT